MNNKNLFWHAVLFSLFTLAVVHTASGQSWTIQFNLGTNETLNGIKAVDENTVWAGSNSQCLRTTNGGITWTRSVVPASANIEFFAVAPIDQNTAYLMGTNTMEADGRIYKTTNGGQTWTLQYQNTKPGVRLHGIVFWDRDNGIAFGDPVEGSFLIVTTNNGGATWEQVPAANIPPPRSGEGAAIGEGGATKITVEGTSNAWFGTRYTSSARVFRSRDKGRTWTVANTPYSPPGGRGGISSIAFIDSLNGFAGCSAQPFTTNNLMQTTDGGKSWSVVSSYPGNTAYTVVYVPKTRNLGLVVTSHNGSFYSQDGGVTWKSISSSLTYFLGLTFASPTVGWARSFSTNVVIMKFNGDLSTAVFEQRLNKPETFALAQNYPNPFNPETRIKFQVPETGWIELEVFNMIGQHVATLLQAKRAAGEYEMSWDGRNDLGQPVPSGIYLLRLRVGNFTQTQKMLLTR